MVNSVHFARIVDLLDGLGWEQHVVPSVQAVPHEELRGVTIHDRVGLRRRLVGAGREVLRRVPRVVRALHLRPRAVAPRAVELLADVIRGLQPDLVFSHELQHAGYMALEARALLTSFPRWAISNWGSDAYLYRRLPEHRLRLEALMRGADIYNCECERDVKIAQELGFRGQVVPVTPIAGGYDVEGCQRFRTPGPTSARRTILLKGYQHWAGRSLVALRALARAPELLTGRRLVVYNASADVRLAARLLASDTGVELELPDHLPHEEMLRLHGQARVSIGLSISDGISQSFLEALLMGSLPVQSFTGCACEWAEDGVSALLVPPEEPEAVEAAVRRALTDDAFVDAAAARNLETARRRLERSSIRATIHAAMRQVEASTRR